jgi:hypothetical protein
MPKTLLLVVEMPDLDAVLKPGARAPCDTVHRHGLTYGDPRHREEIYLPVTLGMVVARYR